MGEVIAFSIVIGTLLLGVLLYSAFRSNKTSDKLTLLTITIPRAEETRVLRELRDLIEGQHVGTVEFYETGHRIVRIVRD